MRRELFEYQLPPELIADRPAAERDGARLLVVGRGAPEHAAISGLDRLIPRGALLVVNDTRVVPARLLGHKVGTGGKVEIFLVRRLGQPGATERWEALGRASKPLREGMEIEFGPDHPSRLCARIIGARAAGAEDGLLEVALHSPTGASVVDAVAALGHVPLPPYLRRGDDTADRERYQTVFARAPGAVAAPTAGLHLSERLLQRLAGAGIERADITLHVGLGTFQPVSAEDLDDHPMHAEAFEIPEATASAVARARARGAPIVAVGTTVVRALESAADLERVGLVRPMIGETRLLIQPGYRFRVIDRLLTNFHLPQSTLLALVSAFAGRERVLRAYRAAIEARYRFYSYGDAMLVAREEAA